MSIKLEVILDFHLQSALHVTGERAQLWTDRVLVRDWHEEKYPVIPATTLKGWLREAVERTLRSLGVNACDGSSPATICGRCPVCEVFGAPQRRSPLRFSDVKLQGATVDTKMHVSLSRYRRTAYEERLFSLEVAWQEACTAHIRGLFSGEKEARQAAALLWLGSRMGYAIGAARSRGLGWLTVRRFAVCIDGQELQKTELAQTLQALVKQTPEIEA